MTRDEMREKLKHADSLLQEYRDAVKPIAEQLAEEKSQHVFGQPGGYSGDLGCWEDGINAICLHIKEGNWLKETGLPSASDWEEKVRRDLGFDKLENVYLIGHF